jgi:AmiR/NasT family two-component response regulator
MAARILIVEDELLIALEMEAIIEENGHQPVGIATSAKEARRIAAAAKVDVALVDLNLSDGPTGPEIGCELAQAGILVIFLTANPRMISRVVPGVLGVLEKPAREKDILNVVSYAAAHCAGAAISPPGALRFLS